MTLSSTQSPTVRLSPEVDAPETSRRPSRPPAHVRLPGRAWAKLGLTMLIPFFLVTVMGLAYLGAFHQPTPQGLQVAIVGKGPAAKVFAQSLKDKAGAALDVRTVPNETAARDLVSQRSLAAAYAPGKTHATLFVSSAASETNAGITQKVFLPIAFEQHLPLQVVDVVPAGIHDTTGQGLFFLLVALSLGGYASAVPLAGFMGKVRLGTRFGLAVAAAAIVSGIGLAIAGPIYGVIQDNVWGIWFVTWLYVSAIVLMGMGLHPLLRHWTTPVLTLIFVALNFTSSGGIFTPEVLPGLFAGISTFWNGAAWLHAVQTFTYFPGQGIGLDVLKLALWLVPGTALMVLTHFWAKHQTRLANENARVSEIDEIVAA